MGEHMDDSTGHDGRSMKTKAHKHAISDGLKAAWKRRKAAALKRATLKQLKAEESELLRLIGIQAAKLEAVRAEILTRAPREKFHILRQFRDELSNNVPAIEMARLYASSLGLDPDAPGAMMATWYAFQELSRRAGTMDPA
jgi:hypothetical protein